MNTVIIVAGGSGTRMAALMKKQYLPLGGVPILQRTLDVFVNSNSIDRICLVVPEEDILFCNNNIIKKIDTKKKIAVTAGGIERQQSAYNGLTYYNDHCDDDIILIHDGVRPLIDQRDIDACVKGAEKYGSAIIGIPAFDTIKKINCEEYIETTLERDTIWLAQTPQAFKYKILTKAYKNAIEKKISGTDDSALVELIGEKIKIIEGRRSNLKITTKEDMAIAETLLKY